MLDGGQNSAEELVGPLVVDEVVAWAPIEGYVFDIGGCYVFSVGDADSDNSDDLFGIFDCQSEGLSLEIASDGGDTYINGPYLVAERYRFVRPMTSFEIRDFSYNMGYNDGSKEVCSKRI